MKKWGLDVRNFFTFPYSLLTSRQSKTILFFTVFWGDLEGAGTLYPRTQATFKSPAPFGLKDLEISSLKG